MTRQPQISGDKTASLPICILGTNMNEQLEFWSNDRVRDEDFLEPDLSSAQTFAAASNSYLVWAAAGFIDTLLRCEMKPEVVYGNEKEIQPRVQA